ncbi:hypothetical protein N7456_002846 [Penicillium angulare]|uniref:C2H2-type domain-containing protein n=1 Tax=Penicillium angulare TaxID=116970 RepID=A0A9W9KHM9_9EURO|nr:hypothetical protein N7456_002846 [Penicillium angulare]
MTSDTYDSDDVMNRSPQLVAQKINYGLENERPPFVSKEDECAKGTPDRSRKTHHTETPIATRYGDGVLMRFLAPDQPEIALHAEQHPLDWSPKQQAQQGNRFQPPPHPPPPKDHPPFNFEANTPKLPPLQPAITATTTTTTTTTPSTISITTTTPATITSPGKEVKLEDATTIKSPPTYRAPTLPPPVPSQEVIKPPGFTSPRRPRLLSLTAPPVTTISVPLGPDHRRASTSEGFSPPDSRHNSDLRPRISLPSLQSLSPPSSVGGPSPDTGSCHNQTLPSIQSALGPELSSRINGFSPATYSYPPSASSRNDSPHDRQLPSILPHQIPPSPFSHFSPLSTKDISNNPSPASQPSFWRTPTSAVSVVPSLPPPPPPSLPPPPPPPQSSDAHNHNPPTPYDMSPMTAKSPTASYPTPTEPVAPTAGDRASFSSHPSPNGGITSIGSYKCTHPGCTAPPFQTQYLLNSHANVHSQDRPHFCPVDGCPRGLGGKGFKRKNEMMRHGLVHNSPGYVCPFCPDQQHKYPRPDNLQRHVRVHHVDKNKDDPILRQVLAQRPIGSTRGRRRRLNG